MCIFASQGKRCEPRRRTTPDPRQTEHASPQLPFTIVLHNTPREQDTKKSSFFSRVLSERDMRYLLIFTNMSERHVRYLPTTLLIKNLTFWGLGLNRTYHRTEKVRFTCIEHHICHPVLVCPCLGRRLENLLCRDESFPKIPAWWPSANRRSL